MKPVLSIIIPCFNNETYIEECITSIASQVDHSVEIIIINDGSTDNSDKIIKTCMENFNNITIKYIKQKNAGAGYARNEGIKFSDGIYLGFLDSDDIWLNDTWKTLKPILLNEENDLIEFDAYKFQTCLDLNSKKKTVFESYFNKIKNSQKNEKLTELFSELRFAPWSRIYHNRIIKNANFLVSCRIGEDIPFTLKAYLNAKKILSLSTPLIGYRSHPQSITKNPKISDIYDRKKIIEKLLEISDQEKCENKKYLIYLVCAQVLATLKLKNLEQKNREISYFIKKIKIRLKKYNYKKNLLKKTFYIYKYDLFAIAFFKTKKIHEKIKNNLQKNLITNYFSKN